MRRVENFSFVFDWEALSRVLTAASPGSALSCQQRIEEAVAALQGWLHASSGPSVITPARYIPGPQAPDRAGPRGKKVTHDRQPATDPMEVDGPQADGEGPANGPAMPQEGGGGGPATPEGGPRGRPKRART